MGAVLDALGDRLGHPHLTWAFGTAERTDGCGEQGGDIGQCGGGRGVWHG